MNWKRNKDRKDNLSPGMEKVAGKIVGGILLVQTKWAKTMSRLFERIPARFRWLVFIGISVVMMLFSGALIFEGLQGRGKKSYLRVNAAIPVAPMNRSPDPIRPVGSLPARILSFKATLDSLGRTREGRLKLDSFFRRRPGLMDSLKKIESIYN